MSFFDRQTDRSRIKVPDHTFLVCLSQRSRRRIFKSSSFVASAANAFYDFVGLWGPLLCLIVCLLSFPSAQSAVYKSLFGTFLSVSLRQHILCLSVVVMDCTHLYLASALGVLYDGHARRDVFLYPYCLLLCINIVIMDCMQLYVASALGVVYGGHARCDVHPRYQEDRQTLFSFLLVSCRCRTLLGSTVVYRALLSLI